VENPNRRVISFAITSLLVFLAFFSQLPSRLSVMAQSNIHKLQGDQIVDISAQDYEGSWWRIKTNYITLLISMRENKPIFVWWESNNTDQGYVAEYVGLTEYLLSETRNYYEHEYQASNQTLKELVDKRYIYPLEIQWARSRCEHEYATISQFYSRIRNMTQDFVFARLGLHPSRLSFESCQWNLTQPVTVTDENGVSYISFNFTLIAAPLKFQFAQNNIVIRCRFYYEGTPAESESEKLKLELVIRNWSWNTDKLRDLYSAIESDPGIGHRWRMAIKNWSLPILNISSGLALQVDLTSKDVSQQEESQSDVELAAHLLKSDSALFEMVVNDQRVNLGDYETQMGDDETPIEATRDNHHTIRFAAGSQILPGFFDFTSSARTVNHMGTTDILVETSYASTGNTLNLFMGYQYFSGDTLEHDPSLGLEEYAMKLPFTLIIGVAGGAVLAVAVILTILRTRKKQLINHEEIA